MNLTTTEKNMKALNKQSLLDLSIQASGHVEGVVALAQENERSVDAQIAAGDIFFTQKIPVIDSDIQRYYTGQNIRPATDAEVSPEDECNYCKLFM